MLDRNRNGDMPNIAYKEQYEREKNLWIREKVELEMEIIKWKSLVNPVKELDQEPGKTAASSARSPSLG